MRFAFYLPALRIDDSGFTFEEFLRNLVNAVKIVSPDNYPYPLYEHYHGASEAGQAVAEAEGPEIPSNRSDEMHRQYENYLHRYKVLPEEAALVRFYKRVRTDIDSASSPRHPLGQINFTEYLEENAAFPAFLDCFDLISSYFLHKPCAALSAAEGLKLVDKCFFDRSEIPFDETLKNLREEYRASSHALPILTFEMETFPRFRRDRLYCVKFDANRPVQSTGSFYAHFVRRDAEADIAYVEAFLSPEESKKYGTSPDGWDELRESVLKMFEQRFTLARTEVSLS